MGFSSYLRNKMLDHAFSGAAFTPPATVYVSLHTADPGDTGASEATGGGYARVAVANDAAHFPAASAGSKSNGAIVTFPTATGDWSAAANMTFFGLWDAASAGNFLGGGALSVTKPVLNGDTADFPVSSMTESLT